MSEIGTGEFAPECVVRAAVDSDLLALLQLLSRADEELRPMPVAPTKDEVASWALMMSTANMTVYVADLGGRLVGTATFLMMPNLGYECRPSGFIEVMVVAAGYRRRGVGRQIVNHLLAEARAKGCHKIQLLTHKRHALDGAHAFYRSVGFEAEAEGFRLYLDPH